MCVCVDASSENSDISHPSLRATPQLQAETELRPVTMMAFSPSPSTDEVGRRSEPAPTPSPSLSPSHSERTMSSVPCQDSDAIGADVLPRAVQPQPDPHVSNRLRRLIAVIANRVALQARPQCPTMRPHESCPCGVLEALTNEAPPLHVKPLREPLAIAGPRSLHPIPLTMAS